MQTPFVMVIFGATGDLMRNKLLPALLSLYKQKKLGDQFYIIGFARRPFSGEEFRDFLKENLHSNDTYHQSEWRTFVKHFYYQQGFFNEQNGYEQLIEVLKKFDDEVGACITRFFYLATPPLNYEEILNNLKQTKLSEGCGQGSNKWTRIIVEKPFGKDLTTAKMLDKKLVDIFEERQIFRVDHYLGKETVQNMIAFRFANGIFEPVWNKNFIDHVQISWGETKGVEGRGEFFDGVGVLRDFAQNHIMQLIAAVAMEQPTSFSQEGVRDARAAAIKAVRCIEPHDVAQYIVRGQYEGYHDVKDVAKDSVTETFLAAKMFVDTPRFQDVPFYIRVGKKMPKDIVEISLVFIQTCHILFKEYGCPEIGNVLTFRIQPNEGIGLRFIAKKPGSALSLEPVDMKFSYGEEFGRKQGNAYEKVLLDIFSGDQMLFNRSDEIESSWEFITNILKGWQQQRGKVVISHKPGTWGPKEANALIEQDNRKWL